MSELSGIEFLDKLYNDTLYNSEQVQHTRQNADKRLEAINRYIERLKRIHSKADTETKKAMLYHCYIDKYIIKEQDIPDSISDKNGIIEDQKKSITTWLDFLSSSEMDIYPAWAKYWVFQGMLKMGPYDSLKQIYTKRDKNTVAPFIDCNPFVVTKCIDAIMGLVKEKDISEEMEVRLSKTDSFRKIYSTFKTKYIDAIAERSDETDGIWKEFGPDDLDELIKSIEGKNTGWCIENPSHAKGYLDRGNFHIYYTKDQDGNYTMPRIAILSSGKNGIDQIRGILPGENLEECMLPMLEQKLKEMDLDEYVLKDNIRKVMNLKKLTDIGIKTEKGIKLTEDELLFFYTTNSFGFGYNNDPKYDKILAKRNFLEDFNRIDDRQAKIYMIVKGKAPKNSIDDEDIMIEALKNSVHCLEYASERLRSDKKIVLLGLFPTKKEGLDVYPMHLSYASDKIKNDKEFILSLVKKSSQFLEFVSDELKDDEEVVLTALQTDCFSLYAFEHASERLKSSKEMIYKVAAIRPNYIHFMSDELKDDEEFLLDLLNKHPNLSLQIASDRLKNKKSFVKEFVSKSGWNIVHCSNELRDDDEIALEAVSDVGDTFGDLSPRLKEDIGLFRIAMETIKNKHVLYHVSPDLFKDTELLKKAVKINGMVYQYAKKEDRENPEIALDAVTEDIRAITFVPIVLFDNEEFMFKILSGDLYNHFKDLSPRLKNKKDFIESLISINSKIYSLMVSDNEVSDEIKKDKSLAYKAYSNDTSIAKDIPKYLLFGDPEFLYELIDISPEILNYVDSEYRDFDEFMLDAIRINKNSFIFASQKLRSDSKFIEAYLKIVDEKDKQL